MKQELIDFLKGLGFTSSQISAIKPLIEKDKLEKEDIESLNVIRGEVSDTLTGLVLNDPDKVKEIRDAQVGKTKNEFETLVKKAFGLTSEEMKDKKLPEVIAFAHKKATEGAGKDNQKILEENIELANRIKELEEVEIPKIKEGVTVEIERIEADNFLISELTDENKRKVIGKPKSILPTILSELDKIGVVRKKNKDGGFDFVHKETGTKIKSKDGLRLLSNDEIIDLALDEAGLKENSSPPDPDSKTKIIKKEEVNDKKDVNQNLGFSEAEENLIRLKGAVKK